MEWPFEVIDQMTAPLKQIASQLERVENELKRASGELGKFETGAKHAGKGANEGAEGAKGFFGALLEMDVLEQAGDLAKELGERVLELGSEFIRTGAEMADFRNGALLSIGAITGNDEAAGDFLETLEHMADGTKSTSEQMFASWQRLGAFTKQFGKKASEDVLAGIADVDVAFGKGASDAVLAAIQNSQAMGKFDERALRGLKESGVATPERLMAVLAEQHHMSVKQIDGLLKAGKISAAEGTNAILGLIREDIDKGGALGQLSKTGADASVGVQIKNFKDHIKELFEKVDTKPLTDALSKLGALFDPGTKRGQQLEAVINRLFKAFGDLVSWATEGDRLAKIFDDVGKYALMAWPLIKGVGYVLAAVGVAAAAITAVIVAPFVLVGGAVLYAIGNIDKIWAKLKTLGTDAVSFGRFFIEGLIHGIESGAAALMKSVTDLGANMEKAIRNKLGIHSKSTVGVEIGGFFTEGFNYGVSKPPSSLAKFPEIKLPAMPEPRGMNDIMLPTPKFSSLGGLGGGDRGGARHFQGGDTYVEINVSGAEHAGDPQALSKAIAQQVQDKMQLAVRSEIIRFMEDDSIAN